MTRWIFAVIVASSFAACSREQPARDDDSAGCDEIVNTYEQIQAVELRRLIDEVSRSGGDDENRFQVFQIISANADRLQPCLPIAYEYLSDAALNGHAESQFILGYSLSEGNVLPKDLETGLAWLERASFQGFLDAQKYLGYRLSLLAAGTDDDDSKSIIRAEAIRWLREAAYGGDLQSKALLGAMLTDEAGTYDEGVAMLMEAASLGSQSASDYLAGLTDGSGPSR